MDLIYLSGNLPETIHSWSQVLNTAKLYFSRVLQRTAISTNIKVWCNVLGSDEVRGANTLMLPWQ